MLKLMSNVGQRYRLWLALCLALLLALLLAALPRDGRGVKAQTSYRVLVFSKTAGFRHDAIAVGTQAIRDLGAANGFTVTATEDAAAFNDANLAQYAAVIFLLTTGDVLDANQQAAFERYIRSGKGYVGIHSASDTEYQWPWYGDLMGAFFGGHPAIQPLVVDVEEHAHPSTVGLPDRWSRTDEPYNFQRNPRSRVHVLASYDETTYTGGTMGDHPISWCHPYDGGRSWYTGMGHTQQSYAEPLFRQHLLGGIRWAAGTVAGNCGNQLPTNTPVPPTNTPVPGCNTNIALNKPATASSALSAAGLAVDGSPTTRWESTHGVDPQWIRVDFGSVQTICRVRLTWEAAYASAYQVQLSNDGTNWNTIYSTTIGDGGVDDLNISGTGRYLRVHGTTRALPYGYSLWEIEVFTGGVVGPSPTPTRTRTNTSGSGPSPTPTRTRTNTSTIPSATPSSCSSANSALNKPATASSALSAAGLAVDGSSTTRWESVHGVDPQWIYVDLGATQSICRVRLNWEAAYARAYQVQAASSTTGPWSTIYSTTASDGGIDDLTALNGSGRYLRIHGTTRALPYGYSLWEIEVFTGGSVGPSPTATRTRTNTAGSGPSPTATRTRTNTTGTGCGTSNVALGRPATASSTENAGTAASLAVDGNAGTRWASAFSDPQWIQVDLGSTRTICRVRLSWEAAYGRAYQVQVAGAASGPWTTIYTTTTGDGGTDDLTGLAGSGRYVRVYGTVRATGWGYSLWEFEVY